MAPTLKLMDITGDLSDPAHIALVQVIQTGPQAGRRFQVSKVRMTRNDQLERNLFDYDDQSFVPFTNDLQFRFLIVDADGGRELGESIIDAEDANNPADQLFHKIFVNGIIGGSFYELGYRVIPG